MSGEFTIFERYIPQKHTGDQIYINLSSDRESVLSTLLLQTINLKSMFNTVSPICTINVIDGAGALMGVNKLDYDAEYFLTFGNNPFESHVSIPIKLASVKFNNNSPQAKPVTQNIGYKLTFVHSNWSDIMNVRRTRSWGTTLYSDVIKKIADECGYSSVDVEDSDSLRQSVIQPYISNSEMIRYVQKRASSSTFDDGYEYGVDINGGFFFKTMSKIIDDQKEDAINQNIPTLTLKPNSVSFYGREEAKSENNGVPDNFFMFKCAESYLDNTVAGGGGAVAAYYDFESGEYVKENISYDQFDSYQLTDWAPIKEAHLETDRIIYSGSNDEYDSIARASITDTINSYIVMGTAIEGTYRLRLGDMVEVVFPLSNPNAEDGQFSVLYSGFYIITGVDHYFDLLNSGYITKLTLYRNGLNGKTLDGYAKTKLGKFSK